MLASTQVVGSTLQVFGSSVDDVLSVREVGGNLNVFSRTPTFSGGDIGSFPRSSVSNIQFIGGDGNDQLVNRTAIPSVFFGGNGNDVLIGGTGNDTINGQNGNDRIFGDFGGTDVGGRDTIRGNDGNDLLFGNANIDLLIGGNGNDQLLGGDGNDRLLGQGGADFLAGQGGNDFLSGGAGNDFLRADFGSNALRGDAGFDLLEINTNTSSSNDLGGGTDSDRFRFIGNGSSTGIDRIREFANQGGNDRVELDRLTTSFSSNLEGDVISEFGNREVRQIPVGQLEFATASRLGPELEVIVSDADFTTNFEDRTLTGVFTVVASDSEGVNRSSPGLLSSVRVRDSGFATQTVSNLSPFRTRTLAGGAVAFDYRYTIGPVRGDIDLSRFTRGFDAIRIEVGDNQFRDLTGLASEPTVIGSVVSSDLTVTPAGAPTLRVVGDNFVSAPTNNTSTATFSVIASDANGIRSSSRGRIANAEIRFAGVTLSTLSSVQSFSNLLPSRTTTLANGDVKFDYSVEIATGNLVVAIDRVRLSVQAGEFVDSSGVANVAGETGAALPAGGDELFPAASPNLEVIGDSTFTFANSTATGSFSILASDQNGISSASSGNLSSVRINYFPTSGFGVNRGFTQTNLTPVI